MTASFSAELVIFRTKNCLMSGANHCGSGWLDRTDSLCFFDAAGMEIAEVAPSANFTLDRRFAPTQ